jgi:hypothetical protein
MTDFFKLYTVKTFTIEVIQVFSIKLEGLLYFGNPSSFTLKLAFLSNGKKRMFLRFKKIALLKKDSH